MSEQDSPGQAYDRDADRDLLLDAILANVAFDGWTMTAFQAGLRETGLDPARGLNAFPGGMAEVMVAFHDRLDKQMLADLDRVDLQAMRTKARIALAVRLRLERAAPWRDAVRAGLSFLLLPGNAVLAAKSLYRTMNAIWYAAGDRSTDFNFYTKRGLLAGVYSATVLYWVNDESEGRAESWAFLDRRLDDAMSLPAKVGKIGRITDYLPNPMRFVRARRRRGGPVAGF